jgi:pimeloyl-ACP methyl ester carboxylesterase
MRTTLTGSSLLALVIAAAGSAAGESGAEDKRLAGYWSGNLAGAIELPVILYLKKDAKGALKWHFDSPFERLKAIASTSSKFTAEEGKLTIQFGTIGCSFSGKLNKEGNKLEGSWKSAGGTFPLTFKRSAKMPLFRRPQEPKPPFPYRSEEVRYENKKAKIKLAGTLTLPRGKGPFPAVILSPGSGLHDRDYEELGHKWFLLIADYLTRRGIGVLRVDDRGVGGSTGSKMDSTSADFAEDVLAGVAFLKGRKEIDGKRIGQIGHSEGAIIGPLAAARSKDIAFLVMLGGTGCTGAETVFQQNVALLKDAGAPNKVIDFHLKCLGMLFDLSNKEKKAELVEKQFYKTLAAWKEKAPPLEKQIIGGWEGPGGKRELNRILQPWYRFFIQHDPAAVLRKARCPVLALIGEKDTQVKQDVHLPLITRALKEGGNKDFTARPMPNLNHMFQTCKTGQANEYGFIRETMAPVVLETMAEWIKKRVGSKK